MPGWGWGQDPAGIGFDATRKHLVPIVGDENIVALAVKTVFVPAMCGLPTG